MRAFGRELTRIGYGLAAIGLILFVGIFVIVLANGSWPQFLEPVRARFAIISDFVGGFALIVEGAIFVGPGILIAWLGQHLAGRHRR
jgi:hypothetical protein